MTARGSVRVLAFALLAVPGAAPALEAAKAFERDVDVVAAGWVRVPLDLPALRHVAAGGRDLRVIGPDGAEVARRLVDPAEHIVRRPARVVEVRPDAAGWRLLVDVGEGAPPHAQLILDLDRRTLAPAVRLEGSADRRTFRPLAEGDLFRVGDGEGQLEQSGISYPATNLRYLRIAWPRAAGFPEVRAVAVEVSPGPSIALSTGDSNCQQSGNALECRLELPAAGTAVRRVELGLESAAATSVGYLLEAPADARWRRLAEGVWQRRAPATRHLLSLDGGGSTAASFLRLSLFSTGAPPELTLVTLELAAREVVFRAPAAGRYTLEYGAGSPRGAPSEETAPIGEAALLSAGPERERPAPPLPTGANIGAPIALEAFSSTWDVAAPGAAPGDVVRLEVPDAAYGAARSDLGDLRLAAAGRQLPYVRASAEEPFRVSAATRVRAEPERQTGWSRVEIDLPRARLPYSLLEISAPGGPLHRALEVRAVRPRDPDPAGREVAIASARLDCDAAAPLPCRLAVPLDGVAASRLAIRFEDGDDSPIGDLDVAVFRRRDALVFVWPPASGAGGEGQVRLVAGAESLGPPSYDLAALGGELLSRPAAPAQVVAEKTEEPGVVRYLLPVVLAVAGLGLLLLLRRILAAA